MYRKRNLFNEKYDLFLKAYTEEELSFFDVDYKRLLAKHNIDGKTLGLLSNEEDFLIHIRVCKSMHTPREVLKNIFYRANENQDHTFIALAENVLIPEEILFELTKKSCCDTFVLIVLNNPNVSERILNYLLDNKNIYKGNSFIQNEIQTKLKIIMEE